MTKIDIQPQPDKTEQDEARAFYDTQLMQNIAEARSPADLALAVVALEHLGWSKTRVTDLKKTLRELDETLNPLLLSHIPKEYGIHEHASALVERLTDEHKYHEQVHRGNFALRIEWNESQGRFTCIKTNLTTNTSTTLKLSPDLGVAKAQFTALEQLVPLQNLDQHVTQEVPAIDLVQSLKAEADKMEEHGKKLLAELRQLTESDQVSTGQLQDMSKKTQAAFARAKELRESALALLPSREVIVTLEDQDVQISAGQMASQHMERDAVIAEQKLARAQKEQTRRAHTITELRARLAEASRAQQEREERADGYDLETLLKKVTTLPVIDQKSPTMSRESDEAQIEREEREMVEHPKWHIPEKRSEKTQPTLGELLDQKKGIEQLIANTREQLDIILGQVAKSYPNTGLFQKMESLDPENTGTKKPSLFTRLRFTWNAIRSGDKNYSRLEQQFKEIIKNRDRTFPERLAAVNREIEKMTYTDADRKNLDARLTRVQKERLRRSPQSPEPSRGVKAR